MLFLLLIETRNLPTSHLVKIVYYMKLASHEVEDAVAFMICELLVRSPCEAVCFAITRL